MGKRYASGKHARAMCDRCGFEIAYTDLRLEWTGLRVCGTCWEYKHPQLTPKIKTDAQALKNPRPDQDDDGTVDTQIEELFPANFRGS